MHLKKIEHIGIAVRHLETSNALFQKLLGAPPYKEEEVPSQGTRASFFLSGPSKIELLAPLDGTGPIARFLEQRGEGLHHIAFAVDNLEAEMERLKGEGFAILPGFPKNGADNKRVAFLHPKGTNGVLVELCQDIREG